MNQTLPSFSDIQQASEQIKPYVNKTPVLTSSTLNKATGSQLFFKCENFQKAGAFKFRGACNAVFSLTKKEAEQGVATHSSGNHGQALALAAKLRGMPAFVVMPENSPKVKIKAVKGYGAEVIFCKPTLQSRIDFLEQTIENTGATFIHPYDNPDVIAGQGTAAKELLESYPDLDLILAPVGGGGLMSGTAITAKHLNSSVTVIGAEPELADDALLSFEAGRRVFPDTTKTIADGLRTTLSERTFTIILENVDDIVSVSEESIIHAMRHIWERMKIIIETSSAVPVAAVLDQKIDLEGKKAGIILTGGNVDFEHLPWQNKEA